MPLRFISVSTYSMLVPTLNNESKSPTTTLTNSNGTRVLLLELPSSLETDSLRVSSGYSLVEILVEEVAPIDGKALIFVNKKASAVEVTDFLRSKSIEAISLHGDKRQEEREYPLVSSSSLSSHETDHDD